MRSPTHRPAPGAARETPRAVRQAIDFVAQRTRALVEGMAMRYGWPNEQARKHDEEKLAELGVALALRGRYNDDACLAAVDIEERLRDWITGRGFRFSADIVPTVEGLDDVVGHASLAAWYEYKRQVAEQEEDAWELADGAAEYLRQQLHEQGGAAA